ncbi:hypothetical protein N7509_005064 [Penicillium cosmopolitanum]|uniref:Uncharacterized protein n=1 Tax=Penicillium cosmopolitanum TaxID=1131564 RepID=A0A9W9W1R4_9EURO|nr:uncharacterized protein N7509_005064 [Penicillium cosmopolitanum]KAJ5396951.1 hypothetical protein N7509_005064 [Penicillium cosmopolitanum]
MPKDTGSFSCSFVLQEGLLYTTSFCLKKHPNTHPNELSSPTIAIDYPRVYELLGGYDGSSNRQCQCQARAFDVFNRAIEQKAGINLANYYDILIEASGANERIYISCFQGMHDRQVMNPQEDCALFF